VRERSTTLEELYEELYQFSRAEILHFHRPVQQRKSTNGSESYRPFKYTRNKEGTSSFDIPHRQVHNIDSDGCGPPRNWDINFRPPQIESKNRTHDPRRD
jgi:hypothetical protein